jgi:hypothetical protein
MNLLRIFKNLPIRIRKFREKKMPVTEKQKDEECVAGQLEKLRCQPLTQESSESMVQEVSRLLADAIHRGQMVAAPALQ